MTGRREAAFRREPTGDYLGSPTGDLITPGTNLDVSDLSLQNALTRMRLPNGNQTHNTIAQNFEGAISVEFTPTHAWWANHLLGAPPTAGGESSAPYSYTWTPVFGQVQSSRWYTGVDFASGNVERELKGVVFPSASIAYSQGENVRVSLTGLVGDEQQNTNLEQAGTSLIGKDGAELVFHGADLQLPDTESLKRLQEGTLDVDMGTRFQRGPQRKPVDAVSGAVTTELSFQKIIEDTTSQLSLAYGNSTAPATGDVDGAASATFDFQTAGDHAQTWNLTGVTPDSYGWSDLVNYDADTLEDLTCYVNKVELVAESSQSTAP